MRHNWLIRLLFGPLIDQQRARFEQHAELNEVLETKLNDLEQRLRRLGEKERDLHAR